MLNTVFITTYLEHDRHLRCPHRNEVRAAVWRNLEGCRHALSLHPATTHVVSHRACCLLLVHLAMRPAGAASLSAKDALIIAKALGFLEPAPAGGTVAVLFGPDAASKADAEAIAALFAGGLSSGGGTITAKPVDAATLGDGAGFIAVIVATGAPADAAMKASRSHKILSITASVADVQAAHCVMAVQTDPEVDLTVNRSAAQEAGLRFAAALAMLIHEI